jgi:hypothetical protein
MRTFLLGSTLHYITFLCCTYKIRYITVYQVMHTYAHVPGRRLSATFAFATDRGPREFSRRSIGRARDSGPSPDWRENVEMYLNLGYAALTIFTFGLGYEERMFIFTFGLGYQEPRGFRLSLIGHRYDSITEY